MTVSRGFGLWILRCLATTLYQPNGQVMHCRELSCTIYPVYYDNNDKPLYDFKSKGIEGGGKQYNTIDIITSHKFNILISFLKYVLSLGSGSFALSDAKMIHSKRVSRPG